MSGPTGHNFVATVEETLIFVAAVAVFCAAT